MCPLTCDPARGEMCTVMSSSLLARTKITPEQNPNHDRKIEGLVTPPRQHDGKTEGLVTPQRQHD
eukprot:10024182-Karenia_brevis.AAC.1